MFSKFANILNDSLAVIEADKADKGGKLPIFRFLCSIFLMLAVSILFISSNFSLKHSTQAVLLGITTCPIND